MNASVLKKVESYCEKHQCKLTEPRFEVLKIITSARKPLGAYEVLKELKEVMQDPKPPTAYRALEFWQELGFIHRIESMNAYVACKAGHNHKGSQFMICNDCGEVTEMHLCDLPQPLKKSAAQNAFKPSHWNLEVHGLCEKCS